MKVVISGGHLTPALAVIHAFQKSRRPVELVFIGREFMQEKEQMLSREKEEMAKRNITFYDIPAAKFHRTHILRNIEEITRLFPSLHQTYQILSKERPDLFLSFGGYLAFPIALVCRILNIPVITHEQTKTAGLANQVIAYLATKIAVSFEESKKFFPKEKVVLTGNPLRPAFARASSKKPAWLSSLPKTSDQLPMIFVTGGSQGSHIINTTLSAILDPLTKRAVVVHQCGTSADSAYLRDLEKQRTQLSLAQQRRYVVREWINEEDVVWMFQHASLVVSRSGANTVQEVVVSKVPAIFIPLPFAHNNEQLKNAQAAAAKGSAVIIGQKDLIPSTLLRTITSCLRRYPVMKKRAEILTQDDGSDAAKRLIAACFEVYDRRQKTA